MKSKPAIHFIMQINNRNNNNNINNNINNWR